MSNQSALVGTHARNWNAASRPSKTNCTSDDTAQLPANESTWRGYWWKEKNAIVDRFLEEMPERAARPVSVRGDELLREDGTQKREDGGYRARRWSAVLNEWLGWYNSYRHAHLVFTDPEGNRVRGQMPNAHQPRYGDRYYARLKALERQMLREFENPHVVMLTLTGSTRNANGGWRCPCDHLRDVVDSWRPDRGRGVYHALRDTLEDYRWEYAVVVEKHESGYGHVHCAVFVDGDVTESDFHSAIDAHLRVCDIAHRDAHDYYAEDVSTRPISVRQVDPDTTQLKGEDEAGPDRANGDTEAVANLGSYIGEYIGAHGEALFERQLNELIFRAVVWVTNTQMVRFSTGANELIDRERDRDDPDSDPPDIVVKDEFEPTADEPGETVDNQAPVEVRNPGWSIEGIGRVDSDGETLYDLQRSRVQYVAIEDASHLDPPDPQSPDRPQRRTERVELSTY